MNHTQEKLVLTPGKLLQQLKLLRVIENDKLSSRLNSVIKRNPQLAYDIVQLTSFLKYDASIKIRIHCLMQQLTQQPTCKTCGVDVKMREDGRYRYTFPDYCSSKCFSQVKEIKKKRAATNKKKYGHDNVLASQHGKNKTKQTNLKRYGVEHTFEKDSPVREQANQTKLDRYGTIHPTQVDQIKQKVKQTNMDRYGVQHTFEKDSPIREQIKQTNLERYGHENVFGSEHGKQKIKQTMKERYGVDNISKHSTTKLKKKQTSISNYGVDNPSKHPDAVSK